MEIHEIRDERSLLEYLKEKLGYCACGAGESGVRLLRDVLEAARDRQAGLDDKDAFRKATARIVALLKLDEDQTLGSWFLHGLEHAGLLYHDKNITDIWPESDGIALLEAISRHYPQRR